MNQLPSIYDLTTGAQLADVLGAVRAIDAPHAYPWEVAAKYAPHVRQAGELWQRNPIVMFDWEPWAISSTHPSFVPHLGSVDPHEATLEAIQIKHQQYTNSIAAVTPLAKERGVRIFVYSYLSLTHKRSNDIYSDGVRYKTWQVEQAAVLDLPVSVDGQTTTLIELLRESNGGVLIPWYVPAAMNEPRFVRKVTTIFSRATDAIGDGAMPLLTPTVAGGNARVVPEIQSALIAMAKERGEFAVWAKPGEVTDEFRKLLREGM